MKNYTGGTIELLLSGDIQTGATIRLSYRRSLSPRRRGAGIKNYWESLDSASSTE